MTDPVVNRLKMPQLAAGELKRSEVRVLMALFEHATIVDAAKALRVHRRTVERVLAKPHVEAAFRSRRAEMMAATSLRLRAAAAEAIEALRDVLKEEGAPGARVSAARALLEMGLRAVELEEIEERIEALEAARTAPGETRQ